VAALALGSTEYADSEQFELKSWRWNLHGDVQNLIRSLNRARHENPALQSNGQLFFHHIDNEHLIAFSKISNDGTSRILTVVNLDTQNVQCGWVDLTLDKLNLSPDCSFIALDLLTGERYTWHGSQNYVALNPLPIPGHVLRLE
jgi:starch synthase (maltosyl-transferring)